MKITNLAILFICIFVPFYLVMDFRTGDQKTAQALSDQYSASLHTAVQDASQMLNMNVLQEYEAGYQSRKFFFANKERALDTFFRTLYLNFDVVNDPVRQGALAGYIPAVAVIDYDGYDLYAVDEYRNANGERVFKHMWRPKKPYSYSDNRGNSINFTLDSYVYAYDFYAKAWVEGFREDLEGTTNIPLLENAANFEAMRKSVIVKSIQQDLAYYINKHNEYATRYGVHYTFRLPQISQEEWVNSIDDIGIMAFIQGIPIGDQFYNNYALGGGRLVKKTEIKGAVDPSTGIKYYYPSTCSYGYREDETFSSERDAAAAGYYPKGCMNR
jgi:hypothetical protein